jgi:hypothetical protein
VGFSGVLVNSRVNGRFLEVEDFVLLFLLPRLVLCVVLPGCSARSKSGQCGGVEHKNYVSHIVY